MNQDLPDYQLLKNQGLVIAEKDLQIILNAINSGIEDVKKYFSSLDSPSPQVTISDKIKEMGFSTRSDSINIPITYLNLISENSTPVDFRDQLVCFVPDTFFVIFKYIYWLRILGRESAIHYYQKIGVPKLSIRFPENIPENLSPKAFILSDLEVEARTVSDLIALQNKENPIWKNVDSYFSEHFSEYYNKPIDYLITLPKPDIQVSFDLENILI